MIDIQFVEGGTKMTDKCVNKGKRLGAILSLEFGPAGMLGREPARFCIQAET
jgi:hypothetical protein